MLGSTAREPLHLVDERIPWPAADEDALELPDGLEWYPTDVPSMLSKPWSAEEQARIDAIEPVGLPLEVLRAPDPRSELDFEIDPRTPEEQAAAYAGRPVFPEPEDRGKAILSILGDVEYVEDLIRPGRIATWAAEEGSGKSYAVGGELAIRVAVAGGSFAGTWPILRQGPVLYLSEMHPDDDYGREAVVLESLGLDRSDLARRFYRLSLMTAAGGSPALTVPEWRSWVTRWAAERGVLLMIVDTATGATQVDPWGQAIQGVYRDLRLMLDEYPDLAVVLIVHLKKPNGRAGDRGISSVLGEWGRWCDVVVLQENDGNSLERAKLTVRKRVRHERRIVATKRGGLLVDPMDLDATGPKVPAAEVVAAVEAQPGLTFAELAIVLDVSKDTAARYVKALGDRLDTSPTGPRGAIRVFPTAAPPQTAA